MNMQLIKIYPLFFIFIAINIILLYIIKYLINYRNKSRDYKIYHFYANNVIIVSYFLIFIILMLYIRYLRWGFYIDLLLLYTKITSFFTSIPIYTTITIIQLLFIVYLLIIHSKNYMIRSLFKRYLYYYHYTIYETLKNINKKNPELSLYEQVIRYPLSIRIMKKLKGSWSYDNFLFLFIHYRITMPYVILTDCKEYPIWLKELIEWVELIMRKLPISLLFGVLIYDCYYNNFILHYVFYYLPFFVIFQIYKKVSTFLQYTSELLNQIIYERYYEESNVIYINTTDEEDEYILNYISLGFKCPSYHVKDEDPEKLWEKKEALLMFPIEFKNLRRFIKIEETPTKYENSLGQVADIADLTVEKIYK